MSKARGSAEFQGQMEQMRSLKQVIFNNDAMGYAPRNGMELMEILGRQEPKIESKSKTE